MGESEGEREGVVVGESVPPPPPLFTPPPKVVGEGVVETEGVPPPTPHTPTLLPGVVEAQEDTEGERDTDVVTLAVLERMAHRLGERVVVGEKVLVEDVEGEGEVVCEPLA